MSATPGWQLPAGFRLAAVTAGIAKGNRPDLLLVVADEPGPAAATFTRNRVVAAPVALSREHLRRSGGRTRAILVNAGCANAGTGPQGDEDAMACANMVAQLLGCEPVEVLLFSTGVIGQRLPLDKFERSLPELAARLTTDVAMVDVATRAILTTDTCPKVFAREVPLHGGGSARLLGFAKGSGMIHPDMATMLAFVLTDFTAGDGMSVLLRGAVEESFHRITVDGDTSTNDAVLLWSTQHHPEPAEPEGAFFEALSAVSRDLALEIARDGEGATKLIEVRVHGAQTPDQALRCARTIASSPLVRTAVHGADANWGRILAAAGRAGVALDTRKIRVGIGSTCLFENDAPQPANEAAATQHLKGRDIVLWVDLAAGGCEASFWTCDLTADYIRINASYRS